MAYATSNPPILVTQALNGGPGSVWIYRSEDGSTVVDGANYITNGGSLGMAIGDLVYVVDTTSGSVITTIHQVNATGDGTTDLTDATTVTQTDSD